jgi:MFS-type transporter involved in bile tolerance (Atg22 family)
MVSQLAKRGRTASALGIAGSFKELGDMLGPLLIGALTQAFSLKVSFVTCGVIGLSSIVFLGIAGSQGVEVEGADSR